MSDDVYVVQTATSGPNGYPYDEIIEVGICRANLETREWEPVLSETVYIDPKELGKEKLDYLTDNYGIMPAHIYDGIPEDKVASDVLAIIKGKDIACYDAKQEFGRYMICKPWDVTYQTHIMPSISARMPISLRCKVPSDEPQIIRKAYRRLLKDDPAGVGRGRRAIDLAKMSVFLMFLMRDKGKY